MLSIEPLLIQYETRSWGKVKSVRKEEILVPWKRFNVLNLPRSPGTSLIKYGDLANAKSHNLL